MSGLCFRMLAGLAVVMTVTGCVTTQPQADGSTKVHLSLGGVSKASQGNAAPPPATEGHPAVVANQAKPDQIAPPGAPGIRATALAGLFSKHPFDGTPKTYFPRAAVTVTDWSRSDCWIGTATIWWSKTKSEAVPFNRYIRIGASTACRSTNDLTSGIAMTSGGDSGRTSGIRLRLVC